MKLTGKSVLVLVVVPTNSVCVDVVAGAGCRVVVDDVGRGVVMTKTFWSTNQKSPSAPSNPSVYVPVGKALNTALGHEKAVYVVRLESEFVLRSTGGGQ